MVRRVSLFHIPAPFSEPCGEQVAGCKCTPPRADGLHSTQTVMSAVQQETSRTTRPRYSPNVLAILVDEEPRQTSTPSASYRPHVAAKEPRRPPTPPTFYHLTAFFLFVLRRWLGGGVDELDQILNFALVTPAWHSAVPVNVFLHSTTERTFFF